MKGDGRLFHTSAKSLHLVLVYSSILSIRYLTVHLPRIFRLPVLVWVLAASLAPHALAQGLVGAPIKLLVPVSPGGTSDVVARLVADRLTHALGQPVVVENRVGATGRIAAMALKNAPPDGRTLLLAPIVVTVIAPFVFKRVEYDPVKDFAPVAQVASYRFALAVTPALPVRTVAEFTAWAKTHPDQANVGTQAVGSVPHFFGEIIRQAARIEMVHVPYLELGQLHAALISGRIPAGICALGDLITLHRAGRVRIIAVSGTRRSPLLPEVPTFVEEGLPAVAGDGWTAVFAPAGTPKPVIARLSAAIVAAAHAPEVVEKLTKLGIEPTGTTPEALARIMAVDTLRWGEVIKAAGFVAR
jgi:tripartite-type tricarboxylate transporter receptor subunit TctC